MPKDPRPSDAPEQGEQAATNVAGDKQAEQLHTRDFEVIDEPLADATPPPVPARGGPPKAARKRKSGGFRATPAQPNQPGRTTLPPLPSASGADEPPDPRLEQARELIRLCEGELEESPSESRAARMHYEIGRASERPLGDLVRAASEYQEALSLLPDHLPSIRGARRVLLMRKNYQAALELFDAEARLWPDAADKAAIFVAKGELLDDPLNRRAEARSAYEQALALAPGDPSVLKAMERWDGDAGDWEALAATWEQAANATGGDVRHRAALIAQRARLLETEGKKTNAAIDLFQTALDLDPGAPGALDALKRLYREHQRWRELVAVLEVEANQTSDSDVASMAWYRVGRLESERLGNLDEAVAALERACALQPQDPLPLTEICVLYEEAARHEALAEALNKLITISTDPSTKLDLIHRLGQVYETALEDDDAAVAWYERALQLEPLFVPALRALSNQYTGREDWPAVIAMNLAEAEATHDVARKAACQRRVAELCESELKAPEAAAEHYAKALGFAPGDETCIKALARLYAEAAEHHRLIELYERALDASPAPEQAIAWLFKIGTTYEDILRQPAQAIGAYRRVLALSPDHLGAIQALQRACERAGRYRELVEALELEATRTTDKTRTVALRYRAGQVLADHLDDAEGAILCFRRVLDVDQAHLPSLAALGRVYYAQGRWEDLLDTYRRQLEVTPRGEAQVGVLHKMGEICEERLGRDQEAVAFYKRAITLDPGSQPSLQRLVHKYQKRREWSELARVLELQIKNLDSVEARAHAAYQLGEVAEEQLGQTDRAISAYVQALAEMPGYRPAFDALTRLRAGRHAWTRLLDDLEREAKRVGDRGLALAAIMRQAEICSTALGDNKRAIALYESVLEEQHDHLGALLALEPLYAKVGDYEQLAQLYIQEARVLTEIGPRVAALKELARVQRRADFGSPDGLRQTYEAILELVPDDLWALTALEDLAVETGNLGLLSDVAKRQAACTDDDALRAAHLIRQAEALEAARSDGALDAYRTALEVEPNNLGAIRGLARVAEQAADAAAMVEALEREAELTQRGQLAAERLIYSARLRSTALNDHEGAVAKLERALERWPDSADAAERLEESLRERGQLQRLADVLTQAAHAVTDSSRAAALWGSVARLHADSLNNVPGAIAALVRVLETDPDHVPTIRQLAELYARDAQWNGARDQLQRVVTLSSDRATLCEVNLRLAAIHAEQLNVPDKAITFLKAVLALEPNHREALKRLADLSTVGGDSGEAASLARRLVSTSTDPGDKAAALLRLARAERAHGRLTTAADALYEAVVLEGPSGPAAAEYESLVSETAAWDRFLDAIEKHLAVAGAEGGDKTPSYLALARTQAGPMGNAKAAVRTLERARAEGLDSIEIGVELAGYKLAMGDATAAAREARRVLGRELTSAHAWRYLALSLDALSRPSEARLAASTSALFGGHDETIEALRTANPPRPGAAQSGSFSAEVLRALDPQSAQFATTEAMLSVLSEGMGKLVAPRLERYRVTQRDKITSAEQHPAYALAKRLGQAFSVNEFDLYVFTYKQKERGFGIEATEPPSLMVPADLTRLSEPQQVFLLGRPFAYLARRAHPLYLMKPQEIEILLAAAARTADETFGFGLSTEEFLKEQNKRIVRALSRRSRRQLEEISAEYVSQPRARFSTFVEALDRVANRAALLLADDLIRCVELLKTTDSDLAKLEGAALVEESDLVRDLAEFWMSDAALDLRRRAGLLPVGNNVWG